MDCHLEGGGRPQIPVFLEERRINEPLRVVFGLELISVPAPLLRLGQPTAERKAGGYKALVVLPRTCDPSGFVCDPLCPVVQVTR